jgi:hypothetical protein
MRLDMRLCTWIVILMMTETLRNKNGKFPKAMYDNFCCAVNRLKQQSLDKRDAPLGDIILIPLTSSPYY